MDGKRYSFHHRTVASSSHSYRNLVAVRRALIQISQAMIGQVSLTAPGHMRLHCPGTTLDKVILVWAGKGHFFSEYAVGHATAACLQASTQLPSVALVVGMVVVYLQVPELRNSSVLTTQLHLSRHLE